MQKHLGYMNRALRSRDPRYARILSRLGYGEVPTVTEVVAAEQVRAPAGGGEGGEPTISQLRETYKQVFGKPPFNGWDAATLSAKIAEKSTAQ